MSVLPSQLLGFGVGGSGSVTDAAPSDVDSARFGDTYQFDFATGQLVESGGEVATLEQTEALQQYLTKLLLTPRYQHLAYSFNYGSSVQSTIARAIAQGAPNVVALAENAVKETLRIDPRVGNVQSVTVELDSPSAPTEAEITANLRDTFGGSLTVAVTIPLQET